MIYLFGVYDGTRYLVLFRAEKNNFIYNRIRKLIEVKSGIIYVSTHNYARVKVNSYDYLPLEEKLIFHNVVMHIKSFWNKDHNHYYYNTFFEKCFYQLPKITILNRFLYKL